MAKRKRPWLLGFESTTDKDEFEFIDAATSADARAELRRMRPDTVRIFSCVKLVTRKR